MKIRGWVQPEWEEGFGKLVPIRTAGFERYVSWPYVFSSKLGCLLFYGGDRCPFEPVEVEVIIKEIK